MGRRSTPGRAPRKAKAGSTAARKPRVSSKRAAARKGTSGKRAPTKGSVPRKAATRVKSGAGKPAPRKASPKGTGRAAKVPSRKRAGGRSRSVPLAPESTPTARRPADRPHTAAPPTRKAPRDRSRAGAGGVRELSWSQLENMARDLASEITASFDPDVVVGVVKGGVFAGREVAAALHRPFLPVRLHARSRDAGGIEASDGMPAELEGKRVLVVDDIAGTGATLRAAVDEAREAGATTVRTCTLVVREGGWRPDFAGVETSDLVVLPWDYEPSTGAVGSAGDEFGV